MIYIPVGSRKRLARIPTKYMTIAQRTAIADLAMSDDFEYFCSPFDDKRWRRDLGKGSILLVWYAKSGGLWAGFLSREGEMSSLIYERKEE